MLNTANNTKRLADPRPGPASRYRSGDDGHPDYARWSIEELRAFAAQLQLPDATRKSRSELLGIFDVSAR